MMKSSTDSKKLEDIIKKLPSKRVGKPEEIADLALFLVSDKSNYINGPNFESGWRYDLVDINHIKILSKNVRKNILKASLEAGSASAHIGGALSSVEILSTLYSEFISFPEKKIGMIEIDLY